MRHIGFIALIPLLVASGLAQATLNVGPGQTFTSVQSAIVAASPGDTVLVQAGVYVEQVDFLGKAITVRSAAGAGATILDGNDLFTLVVFEAGEGPQSVLEGFTIRNGRGSGFPVFSVFAEIAVGGGVYCNGSSPTIRDCVITQNRALRPSGYTGPAPGGGGVACVGGSATFERCEISFNTTGPGSSDSDSDGCDAGPGAGVYCTGGATPLFRDCQIVDNVTGNGAFGGGGLAVPHAGGKGGNGGGVYSSQLFGPATQAVLVNCLIARNRTGDGGAGSDEYPFVGANGPGGDGAGVFGPTTIINCTIVDNVCGTSPMTTLALSGPAGQGGGVAGGGTIVNSIIRGNLPDQMNGQGPLFAPDSCSQISHATGPVAATFSNVQGGAPGVGNFDADPLFLDPANGDYRVAAASPCTDAGDSSAAGLPPLDFEGDARILCGAVDVGFDEVAVTLDAGALWVDSSVPAGCGAETSPFPSIQQAIVAATPGTVIRVRPGIYDEDIDFLGQVILLMSTGGAAVTEIVGSGSGPVVRFESGETGATELQGFTIRGGSATDGGGVRCQGSSPRISACVVRNNAALVRGGGIACDGASPQLANLLLYDNTAPTGAAMSCASGAAPVFVQGTIADNVAASGAGAIHCEGGSSPIVVNSILWANGVTPVNALDTSDPALHYSTVEGGWTGTGSNVLDQDPLFLDAPNDDYRLQGPGGAAVQPSPAIDAGISLGIGSITGGDLPSVDLDQRFRRNGPPDHGAFEFFEVCGPPPLITCDPGGGGNGSLIYAFPGTGEDILLFTLVDGLGDPFADVKQVAPGQVVTYDFLSLDGTFALAPLLVAGQLFAHGNHPAASGIPGVQVDPAQAFTVVDDVAFLGSQGLSLGFSPPPFFVGLTLRIQGFSLSGAAANSAYAASPAFDIEVVAP